MKLFGLGQKGQERLAGIDVEGNYRNLSADCPDLSNKFLANLYQLDSPDLEVDPISDSLPKIGPHVTDIGNFFCLGLNLSDHAAESNMTIAEEPILFFKPTSAICGPSCGIIIPLSSSKTNWEVELSLVIGKEARFVGEADSIDHIASYCIVNNLSARDYQLERGGQGVNGKSSDTFRPIGHWLVLKDEIPKPGDWSMWLDVDGHRFQDGSN